MNFTKMNRCMAIGLAGMLLWPLATVVAATDAQSPGDLLRNAKRLVFLGDSITAAGQYVAYIDAWLVSRRAERTPTVIDAGLSSETVSGLSEAGHAEGRFPRPDLAERLDRVLALTKPNLVVACYGVNCAIYEPFNEQRFKKYQNGVLHLKSLVEQAGAKLVLMTPPFYDDQRSPRPFSYNEVLDRYSDWLLDRRRDGWLVIDLHGPMTQEVNARRAQDAAFAFQPDGVHPNDAGHWFIARQVIRWAGDEASAAAKTPAEMLAAARLPAAALPLIERRMKLLRDSYVSAAGHKRPGVAAGLPVAEAEAKAREITTKLDALAYTPPGQK